MSFALDPRLEADACLIGELALSRALLMNDARYPWIVLVPRRAGLVEITDLDQTEQAQLMQELTLAAGVVRELAEVDKVNIGALGNVVRQLHIHIVGRRIGDPAWPGPVWGVGRAQIYAAPQLNEMLAQLRHKLGITSA